ncbi:hypothetical protein G6F62_014791 [Rhizopus arrhizus]|nr:hypothetical protein G6F62_014791 [Rhizopus arrhizus]
MRAAEQAEMPAHIEVGGVADRLSDVLAEPQADAFSGQRIGIARGGTGQRSVVTVDLVVELQLGHPVVGERMLQRGKTSAHILTPAGPASGIPPHVEPFGSLSIASPPTVSSVRSPRSASSTA